MCPLTYSLAHSLTHSLTHSPTHPLTHSLTQTYMIQRSHGVGHGRPQRDVLFRFGNWCYSGAVELPTTFLLEEIPLIIPTLRMQQHALRYHCDATSVPVDSIYFHSMQHVARAAKMIEEEILSAEETLTKLVGRLEKQGLGGSVKKWLDGNGGPQVVYKLAV